MVFGVLVAAGKGLRFGGKKQFIELAGQPMWAHAAAALWAGGVGNIWMVVPEEDVTHVSAQVEQMGCSAQLTVVAGGPTRFASVRCGLRALWQEPALPDEYWVAIHDAARPFVDPGDVANVLAQARASGGAILAEPCRDTVHQVVAGGGQIAQTVPRETLWLAQTPQVFRGDWLRRVYEQLPASADVTDDAAAVRACGFPVEVVPVHADNRKVTLPTDVSYAQWWAQQRRGGGGMRMGIGFDVHRFAPGRRLRLGGIDIPYEQGLAGHSDADVVLHAVMDALLGALALGDIGQLFPDTDPAYAGADSTQLFQQVWERIKGHGYRLGNLDVVVLAERPRIMPHAPAMRARMAELCAAQPEQISIKATTMERLGAIGRGEGIAAQAVVALRPEEGIW
ncbi:MAG: 2-C-methyl-D-erythritol 2,4-cyclodiphosphate synthase [Alicyclobacillus sp.]|nr:2-C-methyl-D-erythritol 2,4-cyclodiphosphate synthase [Alicyclobacillus sp.]